MWHAWKGKAIKLSPGIWFGALSAAAVVIAFSITIGWYQKQVSDNTRRITVMESNFHGYVANTDNRIRELRALESRVNAIEAVNAATGN